MGGLVLFENAILGVHLLISIGLIATIVLQSGKSAGLGTVGGGAETLFGRKKGLDDVLGRATTVLAVVFMVTSLALTILNQ